MHITPHPEYAHAQYNPRGVSKQSLMQDLKFQLQAFSLQQRQPHQTVLGQGSVAVSGACSPDSWVGE